ncbi:hypothetical protein T484DRAFT_1818223 [Baffinella frigidus]|nr:hypothetical protein T484DRAFT_1818223 [Cryptophyta sp. CCMP2293]
MSMEGQSQGAQMALRRVQTGVNASSAETTLRHGQSEGLPVPLSRQSTDVPHGDIRRAPATLQRQQADTFDPGARFSAPSARSDELRQHIDPRGHLQDILGHHAPPDEIQGGCVWRYRALQRIKWVLTAGNAVLCGTRMTPQEPLQAPSPKTRRRLPSKGRRVGRSRSVEPSDTFRDDPATEPRRSSSTLLRSTANNINRTLAALSSMRPQPTLPPKSQPLLRGNSTTLLPLPERCQSAADQNPRSDTSHAARGSPPFVPPPLRTASDPHDARAARAARDARLASHFAPETSSDSRKP